MRNLTISAIILLIAFACKKVETIIPTPTPIIQEEAIKFTTNLDTGTYNVIDTLPLTISVSTKIPSAGLLYSITSTWTDSSKQIYKLDTSLTTASLILNIPGHKKYGNYSISITVASKTNTNNKLNKSIKFVNEPLSRVKELQLSIAFDSLRVATGNEIANGPLLFDFNGNGKYDIIVHRNRASRTATTYTYEMLNPIVIFDDKRIIEITNLWKGGTTSAVADFNGDGYEDIAVMDNGPEFWDLNPNPPKTPLRVYWNNRGTFDGTNTFVKEMTIGCFNINTGDVDKDGKFEIIPMGNQLEDFSYEFDGTTFIKTEITHLKNISHSPALYGDFDKNGSVDIFSWGFDVSGKLSLAKPTIIHNAAAPTSYFRVNLPDNYYVNLLLSGDFDKNGFVDFILLGRKQGPGGIPIDANHYLYYVENKGGGNYVTNTTKLPEFIVPASNKGYPMLYTVQDFDGDGDLDFYNVNSALNIYFLNENGNFTRWIR